MPPGAYTHDRFYFRFSQGWGYQSLSGRGSQGQANVSGFASSGALLLGGTPGQGIVMGGGLRFASASGSLSGGQYDGYNVTGVTILLGPFVDWFPDVHGGWHIGAMIGLDVLGISNSAISESAGGFAGTLFGGYDFWIGPQWSLGILAAATTGTSGELNDQNNHDSGYGVTPYSFVLEWSLLLH